MGGQTARDAALDIDREQWDVHWADFDDANRRNPAQAYRRRLVLEAIARTAVPSRLLDIGSGNGAFLAAATIRWPHAELLGLELSEAAVARASVNVPSARFRPHDLLRDPVPEQPDTRWATHAVCSEVLEHVDDPVTLLSNARNWLAPDCRIVITVPGGPISAFDRHIGHRRHFSPQDLHEVISAAGLEPLQVAGAGFPFFNLYRALVIARGERLISDARPGAAGTRAGLLTRAGMAAFRPLFRLALPRSRFGWQTIGVAREPTAGRELR